MTVTVRRRNRRNRSLVTVLVGGGVLLGSGLFVGGMVMARTIGDDRGLDPVDDTTTVPSTVAPTTSTTATPTTVPPPTVPPPPDAATDGTLQPGEDGPPVLALQERLRDLGYWIGEPDSTYGALTQQAVMAFQKAEGLDRDGVAGPATRAALATATRPAPLDPSGSHIEIDLDRQILLVVDGGATRWVLNTSTGTGGWATPPGSFAVDREIDGLRRAPLGDLYRPKYFNGGIAIHGSPSIPAHPASHGCARLSNAAMDMLWSSGQAAIGTPVVVH